MSYARNGLNSLTHSVAAIVSVNIADNVAEAMIRDGSSVQVHTDVYVGAVSVIPAVGEQWIIENSVGGWKLVSRLPYNDPPAAQIPPTQGQARLGSGRGPVELSGTSINAHSPVVLMGKATSARPNAVDAGVGAMIYDITLNKPIWSDGTSWRDAAGVVA